MPSGPRRKIGAAQCAEVVERALRSMSSGELPDDQEAREAIIDNVTEEAQDALNALDREFVTYPDDHTHLLFAFVAAHLEDFGSVPNG